jgi:phosphoenolpyruvate synthase/pyruvate phosphate dikinase
MGSGTGSRPIVATRFARSAPDGRLEPYLGHAAIDPAAVDVSVLVQEMMAARASGVAFSRNPHTGLAYVVIEAVRGTGLQLVG